MESKVTFQYFYGTQADQYSFYRIPKALFQDEYFRNLSSDAKILYGLMLDRMSLSIKNQWFDAENRAYIYFSIEDIMELLNCGRNKAIKSLQELDSETGIGLIEKKRQGFGKTNIIYVKSFVMKEEITKEGQTLSKTESESEEKFINQTYEEDNGSQEVYNVNFKKSQNQTSRSPENKLQEVYISNPNYTNISYNKQSDNESDLIQSEGMGYDVDGKSILPAYEELIKENMDFDALLASYPLDKELVQGIYELILETVLCQNDRILIASSWYPAELVKSKFMKLKYAHIEYVMEYMNDRISTYYLFPFKKKCTSLLKRIVISQVYLIALIAVFYWGFVLMYHSTKYSGV